MVQECNIVVNPNCFNSNASFTVNKCNVLKFQSSFPRCKKLVRICEACIDYLEVKLFKIISNIEGSRDPDRPASSMLIEATSRETYTDLVHQLP